VTLFRNQYRVETARFANWDYRSGGWYFVTICTKDKVCSLGSAVDGEITLSRAGTIAEGKLFALATHYSSLRIDTFVVMPNHVHAIIVSDGLHQYSPDSMSAGFRPGGSLGEIVGGYKAGVSRTCHAQGISDFQWQPRFYDRILGSNAAVDAVRLYILQNPGNWQDDPDNPKSIKLKRSSPAVP
jgi:REP-associated tyrosine transposase